MSKFRAAPDTKVNYEVSLSNGRKGKLQGFALTLLILVMFWYVYCLTPIRSCTLLDVLE